jgi:hypothetical protein
MMKLDFHKLRSTHYAVALSIIIPTLFSPAAFLYIFHKDLYISLETVKLILLTLGIGAPIWLAFTYILQTLYMRRMAKLYDHGFFDDIFEDLDDEAEDEAWEEMGEEVTKVNAMRAAFYTLSGFGLTCIIELCFKPNMNGEKTLFLILPILLIQDVIVETFLLQRELRELKQENSSETTPTT